MIYTEAELSRDIDRVKQISIVSTLLDVVCQTTGMGFAAVARVTQDRWIACSVRDEIQFGLVPGGELKVETTICNEIRDHREAVVIDHVRESEAFCNHHTPLMYGFQSYISFPIILKNGEFFGTLCAIDPNPAQLNNSKVIGMFSLFADLISFHLQQVELLERSRVVAQNLNQQLTDSLDENRQYRHISNHNLQEPLRKLQIFSEMLIDATDRKDADQSKNLALKINVNAQKFSLMIKNLSDFSMLDEEEPFFELVDVNTVIDDVCVQLGSQLKARNARVEVGILPSIPAIPHQLEQLFYHLIHNAVKFSKKDTALMITISGSELIRSQLGAPVSVENGLKFLEIRIEDNGIGIEQSQLKKIFDLFSQLQNTKGLEGGGTGLAYCRKIIRNHSGLLKVHSEIGVGTSFSIILPIER